MYKCVITACILAMPITSNSAIVEYSIEGDMELLYGDDQVYSLNGAHFEWTVLADTGTAHIPGTLFAPYKNGEKQYSVLYASLSSHMRMTNRSNGASDTIAMGSAPNIQIVNSQNTGVNLDEFNIFESSLTGQFDGLARTSWHTGFSSDFYLIDGIASMPDSLDFKEVLSLAWGRFESDDGLIRYETTNWNMTVTVIPIPAAVWLFGSGLLGLAGVARRKRYD